MASTFGWFAIDPDERRRMMEAVDQFRDKTTVDDLGIGQIRDSFADLFFPGISTLHTRIRYVLFLPWLMEIASRQDTIEAMHFEMRDLETILITALETGGELTGVIGQDARKNLSRPPSVMYWSALKAWGIISEDLTLRNYFERCFWQRQQDGKAPVRENPDVASHEIDLGIHQYLPLNPGGLLTSTTFALTAGEAEYLRQNISYFQRDSLLAYLVQNRPSLWHDSDFNVEYCWDPMITEDLPAELQRPIDLAERFSFYSHGASLLYNLMLADKSGHEAQENYQEKLQRWSEEATDMATLEHSDQLDIWAIVTGQNRSLSGQTKEFFSTWFESVPRVENPATNLALRRLISEREFQTKKNRARLHNKKSLDNWGGKSGATRLDFRWRFVQSHLQDIYAGLGEI